MFVNSSRLPHVLAPQTYWSPSHFEQERSRLFLPNWLSIGAAADVANDGDFFTCDLFETPLLVRNHRGRIQAYLNVCPHRHCMLTHIVRGHSPVMRCQYHGWEFSEDGRTGKIPDAQCFRPMPGGPECLHTYPTEVRGPLVFASLNAQPRNIHQQLGPLNAVLDEFPAERWTLIDQWHYDFQANWKLIVENTVEAYHVSEVHPKTLVQFSSAEATEHKIFDEGTMMHSSITAPSYYHGLANWVSWNLQPGSTNRYRLYHGFPNLFLIRIDVMLQVMTVVPTSPDSSRLEVKVFILRAARHGWRSRCLGHIWGKFKAAFIKRVLAEDAAIYPDMHRGMKSSPFRGTISIREELVHAFQDYIARECDLSPAKPETGV